MSCIDLKIDTSGHSYQNIKKALIAAAECFIVHCLSDRLLDERFDRDSFQEEAEYALKQFRCLLNIDPRLIVKICFNDVDRKVVIKVIESF